MFDRLIRPGVKIVAPLEDKSRSPRFLFLNCSFQNIAEHLLTEPRTGFYSGMERKWAEGLLVGFCAGAAVATGIYVVGWRSTLLDGGAPSTGKRDRFRVDGRDDVSFEDYVPPLPDDVKTMLCEASLCHLSCMDGDSAPHTSLMNFTFVQGEGDVIVMTTRRDTKKYELMEKFPHVSLLLHDFPQVKTNESSFKRTLSISIKGIATIETTRAEKYRTIHLNKNMQYSQFIKGEDKAVITIKIMHARMCNIQV